MAVEDSCLAAQCGAVTEEGVRAEYASPHANTSANIENHVHCEGHVKRSLHNTQYIQACKLWAVASEDVSVVTAQLLPNSGTLHSSLQCSTAQQQAGRAYRYRLGRAWCHTSS